MSKTMWAFIFCFSISSLFISEVRGSSPILALKDMNDFLYFIRYAKDLQQDIDADGKADIFREFHSNGVLKTIQFDTSRATFNEEGKIVLWERLDSQGKVYYREKYNSKENNVDFLWMQEFDKDVDGIFEKKKLITDAGNGKTLAKTFLIKNRNPVPVLVDQKFLSSTEMHSGENQCGPLGQAQIATALSQLDQVISGVGSFIQVQDSCSGGIPILTPPRVINRINPQRISEEATLVAQQGLRCLADMGENSLGRELAARIVTNTFGNPSQQLKIGCDPAGTMECWRQLGASWCGSASHPSDRHHPEILFGTTSCLNSQTGFRRTLFHELIHTSGERHHYHNANDRETVEACAQCCFYEASNNEPAGVQNTMCKLCRNEITNPIKHNLAFAWARFSAGSSSVQVLNELYKVTILDPNNIEAWHLMIRVIGEKMQSGSANRTEKTMALHALRRLRFLEANPSLVNPNNILRKKWQTSGFCQADTNAFDREHCQNLFDVTISDLEDEVVQFPPLGLMDLDLVRGTGSRRGAQEIVELRARLEVIKTFCGPFSNSSEETDDTEELEARNCSRLYSQVVDEMEQVRADILAQTGAEGEIMTARRASCTDRLNGLGVSIDQNRMNLCLRSQYSRQMANGRVLPEAQNLESLNSLISNSRTWLESSAPRPGLADPEATDDHNVGTCPNPHER